MPYLKRVLVIVSPDWRDEKVVREALTKEIDQPDLWLTIVTGSSSHCAELVDAAAAQLPCRVHRERHDSRVTVSEIGAAFVRNAQVVSLGADICLSFVVDPDPVTRHMIDLVDEWGIPHRRQLDVRGSQASADRTEGPARRDAE